MTFGFPNSKKNSFRLLWYLAYRQIHCITLYLEYYWYWLLILQEILKFVMWFSFWLNLLLTWRYLWLPIFVPCFVRFCCRKIWHYFLDSVHFGLHLPNVRFMSFGRVVECWNWCQNLIVYLHFFAVSKKEQVSEEYFYCNHETFSIPWRCPKINFTVTVLKTQQAKYSKFDKDFDIRKPVQMTWSVYQSGENKWSEFRIVRYEFGSSVHISIWKSVEGKSRVC